jgi:hypothetical protein
MKGEKALEDLQFILAIASVVFLMVVASIGIGYMMGKRLTILRSTDAAVIDTRRPKKVDPGPLEEPEGDLFNDLLRDPEENTDERIPTT